MAWMDPADKGRGALDLDVATASRESTLGGGDRLMDQRDTVRRDTLQRDLAASDRGNERCTINEAKEAGGPR